MVKMFDISKNELFDNAISNKIVFAPYDIVLKQCIIKLVFKTIHIVYPNNIDSI